MNTGELSFQITVFSGCISRSKTAGSHDSSIASILLFTEAAPVYIPVNGLSVCGVPFLHVLTMLFVWFFFFFDDRNSERCEVLN